MARRSKFWDAVRITVDMLEICLIVALFIVDRQEGDHADLAES